MPCSRYCHALLVATLLLPTAAHAELLLHDAWMGAVPPTSKVGAVYLVLENTGPEALQLGHASSPDFPRVELHQSVHAEGRVHMQARESLTLAPGERIDFSTTGHHFMIWFNGQPAPAPGARVRLAVEVTGGPALSVSAEVRRPGQFGDTAEQDHGHHHPGHDHGPAQDPALDPHAGH